MSTPKESRTFALKLDSPHVADIDAAPSPILSQYNWPGQYAPAAHQSETASFLTLNSRCLVLNEPGTGKAQTALWAADYLIETERVKKVLVIAPIIEAARVWGDGIVADFPHRKFVALLGTAEERAELLRTEADFYIIGHDGFANIYTNFLKSHCHGMFDLIIVDEVKTIRNPATQRLKVLLPWVDSNPQSRLWVWVPAW